MENNINIEGMKEKEDKIMYETGNKIRRLISLTLCDG
jgi:hypothetical protein